jgi:hypothetical protein
MQCYKRACATPRPADTMDGYKPAPRREDRRFDRDRDYRGGAGHGGYGQAPAVASGEPVTWRSLDQKSISNAVNFGDAGDWLCDQCDNHNYASRETCKRCHRGHKSPDNQRAFDELCVRFSALQRGDSKRQGMNQRHGERYQRRDRGHGRDYGHGHGHGHGYGSSQGGYPPAYGQGGYGNSYGAGGPGAGAYYPPYGGYGYGQPAGGYAPPGYEGYGQPAGGYPPYPAQQQYGAYPPYPAPQQQYPAPPAQPGAASTYPPGAPPTQPPY